MSNTEILIDNNVLSCLTIVPPTTCPSCANKLVLVKDQLFCRSIECPAQSIKKLESYTKILGIKGIGPKTLEKLGFVEPIELYTCSEAQLVSKLGSEAIGTKVYASIQVSRKVELATLIQSFNVQLVGKSASQKLAKVVSSIDGINNHTCKSAGLGQVATANLIEWLATVWVDGHKSDLLQYLTVTATSNSEKSTDPKKENLGISVAITGKLDNYKNRAEAATYLESKGFTVKAGVSSKVDYLISEEGRESSSTKKANKLGVPITSIAELIKTL